MATIDKDAVDAAKRRRAATGQSNFPAVNQLSNSRNTAFARNAPINTPAMNALNSLNQIPIGGFGLGALSQAGYSRSPQVNLGNFMNQGAGQQQEPTLTGYHWRAATGGVSGGNNAFSRYDWSNGTSTIGPANSQYDMPRLGLPRSEQPAIGQNPPDQSQAPAQYPTTAQGNVNYNVPGGSMQDALQSIAPPGQDYNASTGQYLPASTPGFMSATKGPSQFASAPRTTNQFGQQMINTSNGGQMTTDKRFPDKRNQPWLGGQSWSGGGY